MRLLWFCLFSDSLLEPRRRRRPPLARTRRSVSAPARRLIHPISTKVSTLSPLTVLSTSKKDSFLSVFSLPPQFSSRFTLIRVSRTRPWPFSTHLSTTFSSVSPPRLPSSRPIRKNRPFRPVRSRPRSASSCLVNFPSMRFPRVPSRSPSFPRVASDNWIGVGDGVSICWYFIACIC